MKTKNKLKPKTVRVFVWECNSWSGRKLDYIKEFPNRGLAKIWANHINKHNNKPQVPEYYIKAELEESINYIAR